jgi:hypothetical protein
LVLFGPSIDRRAFSKDVRIADDHLGRGTLVRKILRLAADDTSGKKTIVSADGGVAGDRYAVFQTCATSDPHVWANDAMMPDPNVFVEFSSRVHHSGMSDDR